MHSKEDPLNSTRPPQKVTLWLDRENMLEARENYWSAYLRYGTMSVLAGTPGSPLSPKEAWDISFAAAVAAFDFLMAGKVTP